MIVLTTRSLKLILLLVKKAWVVGKKQKNYEIKGGTLNKSGRAVSKILIFTTYMTLELI